MDHSHRLSAPSAWLAICEATARAVRRGRLWKLARRPSQCPIFAALPVCARSATRECWHKRRRGSAVLEAVFGICRSGAPPKIIGSI